MDKALERALENEVIDPSKCDGNYLDVYPLIGAVLKRELSVLLLTIMQEIIKINKYYYNEKTEYRKGIISYP